MNNTMPKISSRNMKTKRRLWWQSYTASSKKTFKNRIKRMCDIGDAYIDGFSDGCKFAYLEDKEWKA